MQIVIENTRLVSQAATELGIASREVTNIFGVELYMGSSKYFYRRQYVPLNNSSSADVAENKYCVNRVLAASGFPVPNADAIMREAFAAGDYDLTELKFPLAIKPTVVASGGAGVVVNIQDEAQLQTHFDKAFKKYPCMSVETYQPNLRVYRVLILQGKVIGVVEIIPPAIKGDGTSSITQLVEGENEKRAALAERLPLGPLVLDDEAQAKLAAKKMTPETVLALDKVVRLSDVCSLMRGATLRTLEKSICPENAGLLIRAAKELDLQFVSFKVACKDIQTPLKTSKGMIISASAHPDLTLFENANVGKPVKVARQLVVALMRRHPLLYFRYWWRRNRINKSFYFRVIVLVLILLVGKALLDFF